MEKVVDARLQLEKVVDEITRVVQIGLLCTQAKPDERPAMSRVVELLRDKDGACGDAEVVLGEPRFSRSRSTSGEASKAKHASCCPETRPLMRYPGGRIEFRGP